MEESVLRSLLAPRPETGSAAVADTVSFVPQLFLISCVRLQAKTDVRKEIEGKGDKEKEAKEGEEPDDRNKYADRSCCTE